MLCGSIIIYLSSPQTQPVQTRTPDLSLKVWSSSGILHQEHGITIHSHEYNRNLEIMLDISCHSPPQIQSTTHSDCCLPLKISLLSSIPHHHPSLEVIISILG